VQPPAQQAACTATAAGQTQPAPASPLKQNHASAAQTSSARAPELPANANKGVATLQRPGAAQAHPLAAPSPSTGTGVSTLATPHPTPGTASNKHAADASAAAKGQQASSAAAAAAVASTAPAAGAAGAAPAAGTSGQAQQGAGVSELLPRLAAGGSSTQQAAGGSCPGLAAAAPWFGCCCLERCMGIGW